MDFCELRECASTTGSQKQTLFSYFVEFLTSFHVKWPMDSKSIRPASSHYVSLLLLLLLFYTYSFCFSSVASMSCCVLMFSFQKRFEKTVKDSKTMPYCAVWLDKSPLLLVFFSPPLIFFHISVVLSVPFVSLCLYPSTSLWLVWTYVQILCRGVADKLPPPTCLKMFPLLIWRTWDWSSTPPEAALY